MIFDGEYFKDKKWKGKGYDKNGNIIYELSNDQNGKVEDYNENGKLILKGEYLEGKMHGIVKKFAYNGKLIFEGEYRRGKMHGTVKEFNNLILFYFEDLFSPLKYSPSYSKFSLIYSLPFNFELYK